MTCFLVKLVACPSEFLTLDPANLACPNWPPATGTGIVKRPTPCSVLVGIQPRHLPQGSIWSKGNLLPCSILRQHLATLVWRLGAGRATLCHLVRCLGVCIGTPCPPVRRLIADRITFCHHVRRLGVGLGTPCHSFQWFDVNKTIPCQIHLRIW